MAAIGFAPPGPRNAANLVEPLRATTGVSALQNMTVSFLRSGDAQGPRLVFVHGTPGSAASWADYLLTPPRGVEVVALDRPGFGLSEPVHAMPSLADQANAVCALLACDGRPTVLVGHSLGGPVVARLAADHPTRVAGIVLLAASLSPALETIHPLQRVGAWPPVRALLPRAIRNANTELLALKSELESLAPGLAQITAPVFIVHGTADDLVPVANVSYTQARLASACHVKTMLLEGRNHFLPWNSELEVRTAISMALDAAC